MTEAEWLACIDRNQMFREAKSSNATDVISQHP